MSKPPKKISVGEMEFRVSPFKIPGCHFFFFKNLKESGPVTTVETQVDEHLCHWGSWVLRMGLLILEFTEIQTHNLERPWVCACGCCKACGFVSSHSNQNPQHREVLWLAPEVFSLLFVCSLLPFPYRTNVP